MTKCRTTHHHACACREARFERMERALVAIQLLANQADDRVGAMRCIEEMCCVARSEEAVTDADYRPLPGDEGQ